MGSLLKLYCVLHLLLLSSLLQAQELSDSSAIRYESPYILSQWNGGTFPGNDVNLSFQSTWLVLNKINFNYKDKFEAGLNLHGENFSSFLKYHQNITDNFRISPSVYIVRGFEINSTGLDNKGLLFNPGFSISVNSQNKRTGLIFSYYRILGEEDRLKDFIFDIAAKDYFYGFNFYHFMTEKWLFNFELISANIREFNSVSQESHALASLSYSRNTIVSYDFGFWTQLNNRDQHCDLFCIYFLPMFGITVDLSRAVENGKKYKQN